MRTRKYWTITAYYNETVEPPKYPGDLALSTRCYSESMRDIEVEVCHERDDIGSIIVTKGVEK